MHQFDTDDYPERDRSALFYDVFAREFMGVQVDEVDDATPLRHRMRMWTLPDLRIMRAQNTPLGFRRGKAMLRDHQEEMLFILVHEGEARFRQSGRDVLAAQGEALIGGTHRSCEGGNSPGYGCTTIAIPRAVLARHVDDPERALARHVPRSSSTLRLLDHYLGSLFRMDAAELDPATRELAARHVLDMVAMHFRDRDATVGEREERDTRSGPRSSLRAARLRAIRDDIRACLGESALSVGFMAARHGISVNYLGLLFRDEGTTFTDFVRGERLDRAWRRLVDPRHLHASIATIAYDAGFNDVSYFNRAFRRRFGRSPTEARALAYDNRRG